jgi:hypothetical protein
MREQNQVLENEDGDISVPAEDDGVEISPVNGVNPVQRATKTTISAEGISDMWETTLTTTSKEMADAVLPVKEAASQEITIGFRGGIHFGTHMAFKQAGISATVTYLAAEGDNVQQIPSRPIKDFKLMKASMVAGGFESPADIPVLVESEDVEQAVQIIQAGGMGAGPMGGPEAAQPMAKKAAEASPANKTPVLPQKKERASDEPKGEVVSDQLKPVEADTRTIEREEREENGAIIRSERIHEQTGEAAELEPAAPEDVPAEPVEEPVEAPEEESQEEFAYSSEQRLLAAFALAEDAVELDLVTKEEKMAFISELEKESMEQLEARRSMLDRVKVAGLSKKTARVAGLGRVPRLAHSVASSNNSVIDDTPDAALFL